MDELSTWPNGQAVEFCSSHKQLRQVQFTLPALGRHFAGLAITQAQFRVLLAIWQQGGADGIAPSALADYLLIERGTVSVLTNRMVEHGWLTRRPGENRRT